HPLASVNQNRASISKRLPASINIGIIIPAATFSSCLSRVSHPDCRATGHPIFGSILHSKRSVANSDGRVQLASARSYKGKGQMQNRCQFRLADWAVDVTNLRR
ncbi:MAG TPA: hypothetical protein VJU59_02715, partial [Paraburkholderia sp.]|uniref:hypothetical protein n=1 Tax=Paraburkholderia sp. TaxID=1926495 RepID=UPI002B49A05E